jgi:mono/diheme cytochrome c family protein/glucose/arabinose dehydrogenase
MVRMLSTAVLAMKVVAVLCDVIRSGRVGVRFVLILLLTAACGEHDWPPRVQQVPPGGPPLPAQEALKTFSLPPGYRIELVAAEPMIQDPVAIDFDSDGRMYVVEMRGFMPNADAEGEDQPVGRVVVLEDLNGDGRMDRSTVFLDSLVLPRAVKVLEHGVLVAAPPYLWLARDTTGDGRADVREVVREDYGDPAINPEHNANGLHWGLDNWIHNSQDHAQSRLRNGRFEHRQVPRVGQWGVSIDDYGRVYRNFNESPLHADVVSAHYLARNPNQSRRRGVYERLTENVPVWPVRPTPGVNRGYREQTLRPDSTLSHFTAAGSPVVYRGDLLPAELQNNVFITEPAANLVRRWVVTEDEQGLLSAENPYSEAEFLASTDERFRPVNLYSGPDGALYVVDMYRGIIQHQHYLTDYLRDHIHAHGLEDPGSYGRIYRIVPDSPWYERVLRGVGWRRASRPRLSGEPAPALVEHLAHPDGWWRSNAQRILVERADRTVAPALRDLVRGAEDARTRLHALWTLDGLGEADPQTLAGALQDRSPHVRAAAVRISEPWLARPGHELRDAVVRLLDDRTPTVRRQLAASVGEFPRAAREALYVDLLGRYGDDPVVVDLVVSGLHDRESAFLKQLFSNHAGGEQRRTDAVGVLAAAVMRTNDEAAIHELIDWMGDEARPIRYRLALMEGMGTVLPRSRNELRDVQPFLLGRRPDGLLDAAASEDPAIRSTAQDLVRRVDWPGRPRPAGPEVSPLTAGERRLYELGQREYGTLCAGCHQPNGTGLPGMATPLVGSEWVLGHPRNLIRIVLQGKEGEMLMPPMGAALSDEQLAAVLTYIRRSWGHQAAPVSPAQVSEIRGRTAGRDRPWTPEELTRLDRQESAAGGTR